MRMKYKIEKNVKLIGNLRNEYPFKDMSVGDSFEFKIEKYATISSAASWHGKRHGVKFTIRGNRIWRIT